MRIASGVTDQYIYFVAVDATDLKTRETGLTTFTVYRSRNGAAAAAMTTPTINEVDATNMPGVYELLLDEDMTIGAGNLTESMTFHITHAGMAAVTREIELFDPNNYTIGTVTANTDMRGTDSAATATALATAQSDLDILTGSDGVTLASSQPNSLTFADITSSVTGATDNITFNGSGTGDVFAYTRGGTSNLFDAAYSTALQSEVNAACDTALTDYDAATGTELAAVDTKIDALPTAVENADAFLDRDMSTGTDSGSTTVRTPRQALRFLRNKWAVAGTTLTVNKEDDATASWTATVTTDATADPVTGSDPA